jgi:3-methylfumaryl-CoA hydratase
LDQTASIKDWVGRTRKEEDEVTLGAVRRMAATLDQDPSAYHRGSEMPESWYAILFGPTAREATLARDGHPITRDFLPPLPNARRMFGGRRVRFFAPLRVGDRVERVSTVTRAEEKTGRSGALTLLTVVHEVDAGAGIAVTEEQDLVYRAAFARGPSATAATAAAKPQPQAAPEPDKPDWSRVIVPDPVLLFRYSALTFNAHRIHYDLPYARDIEGYPALVMNGGLTALLLVETARTHLPRRIAGYAARALHPLFVGQSITFNGRLSGETAELWACGPDGTRAYQVSVSLGQRRRP